MHDKIGQALLMPEGYTLQTLDLDNICWKLLSEYFLAPSFVEIHNNASIKMTRVDVASRQYFTLTPGASLEKLCLHRSFDMRALPCND